jgi:hypothetical protein
MESGLGPGGRRFKSSLPDQYFQADKHHFWFFGYSGVGNFEAEESLEFNNLCSSHSTTNDGTTITAWQSSIGFGFGDNTLHPFNSDNGNSYTNTAAGLIKVDWFNEISMSGPVPGPQVLAYIFGKLIWTGDRIWTHAPITNYLPFQDPVESRSMAKALIQKRYRDLFTAAFMKENCPQ